jgi:pteridine reductase
VTDSGASLTGRRALVTGAGRRVGRAIALALGGRGMHVAVHHHASKEAARDTCEQVERAGGRAFAIGADLRQRTAARGLVDAATARLGGLDLLVASAADFVRVEFEAIDDAAWDRMLELNLSAPFVLAHRAAAHLRATRGSIVFITCTSSMAPYRNHLPYVVAKGALGHLTRALSLELAPEVRVNAVAPGVVLPPAGTTSADLERLAGRVPLGRTGKAEDVARAVVFLAESPYVTGVELAVDGGRSVARAGSPD